MLGSLWDDSFLDACSLDFQVDGVVEGLFVGVGLS